ncbi:MerR family transcriptional regulator [Catenuloplanes sp. NPDC051500]|uniref:MerR family transcriptional regulator n=1 Tax=Catenuloplanes sp. NPDC051500 TaxID=3363959 RepID=UPI00379F1899
METPLGIRKLSELTGLTPHTLRWYEREGIIPAVDRSADGRRLYSPEAVRVVRFVQALRRTGMPVAEVRGFVRLGPGSPANHQRRLEALRRQEAALRHRIADLHGDLRAVQEKIADYDDMIATGRACEHDD